MSDSMDKVPSQTSTSRIVCSGCGVEKARGEIAFIPLLDGNGEVRQKTKPFCWKCLIYRRTVVYKDGEPSIM